MCIFRKHNKIKIKSLSLSLFLVGMDLQASCLQSRHSTAGATPPVHFALGIFGGKLELFAWDGLKPHFS
jgi:hypothetical protein